jgi:hypothetical protein
MDTMNQEYLTHYMQWAKSFSQDVNLSFTYCPGRIHHLYHGSFGNRNYIPNQKALARLKFDPELDVGLTHKQLLQLTERGQRLQPFLNVFMKERQEDV